MEYFVMDDFKILETVFYKDGYKYTQLYRKGRIALYLMKGIDKDSIPHYEVIIIREVKADKFLNQSAREAYTSSYDWGIKAWTFMSLDDANKKIGELIMQGKFI